MTFNSQETFQSNNRPTPKEIMAWFQLLITLITTTLFIGLHLTLMRPPAPRAAEHLSCRWCAPDRSFIIELVQRQDWVRCCSGPSWLATTHSSGPTAHPHLV